MKRPNMVRKKYSFFLSLILLIFLIGVTGCQEKEVQTPDCTLEVDQARKQANDRKDSLLAVIESLEAEMAQGSADSQVKTDSLTGVIHRLNNPPIPEPDGIPIWTDPKK